MDAALKCLMEGLIDYAGLYPPASLDMATAVRKYAEFGKSPEATWLGRFVLPAARLKEYMRLVPEPAPASLSVIVGDVPDLKAALDFPAPIDVIETRVTKREEILAVMKTLTRGVIPYFEVPLKDDPLPLLETIAASGGRAKMRTGGITPEMIPSPAEVARFLARCARLVLPFKATSGLHHPFRALRPLTYAPDAPKGVMHGFLNVFVAAVFAAERLDEATLTQVIAEESPEAFAFESGKLGWRGRFVPAATVRAARKAFAQSFGSCSFEEPRADLQEARLT